MKRKAIKKKTKKAEFLEFPCLKINQGKTELAFFTANTSLIWTFVQINKRDPDKDTGYQRALSQSRVKSIAKYIDDGNPIPNTILVALNKAKFSDGKRKLIIPKR